MIARDKKRALLIQRFFNKRKILKTNLKEAQSFQKKLEINIALQKLPKNSSPNRLRNRCWKTGRPRAFYRFFGLSRHVLREMAYEGLLPGVVKASW